MEALKKFQLKGKVRLVGEGSNEIVSFEEAWKQAEEAGLDLCLVGEGETPVVRILDLKKIEYEKKKAQKKTPKIETKEIQLKVNISPHDLETKLRKVKDLLEDKQRVKLLVKLKGRESPERAEELLNKVLKQVSARITRIPGGALLE